jgi:hypothetical protein
MGDDRSAALVIRVWLEEETNQFRGRITAVDTSAGSEGGEGISLAVASSPSDLTDAVREWLYEFISDAPKRVDNE